MIRTSIKGLEESLKAINDLSKAMSSSTRKRIGEKIANDALTLVKEFTPGKGTIREQWQVTPKRNYTWEITNQAAQTQEGKKIIEVLEYGSRPHIIRPKYKQVLHFYIGNDEIFAKEVHHPGTKAYMMLRRASIILDRAIRHIGKAALDELTKIWR
jgi:hypothetical protein